MDRELQSSGRKITTFAMGNGFTRIFASNENCMSAFFVRTPAERM